jgi:hypothetical protein
MAVQLNAIAPTLLPPTITGPIFAKAAEQSAVMSLARRVPLSVTAQTAIPVPMDIPTAGWVNEGGVKPASQEGIGVKVMTGKKLALLLPVSQEVVMTNAAGLYSQIQQDLPTAMSRAFDQAAINGKDLRSGGAGPFSDYLTQTGNTQALGTATPAQGGLYTDLVQGMGKVVDRNFDFTGFAADPRLKIDALLSVDTIGRPLFIDAPYQSVNDGGGINTVNSSLVSTPVAFSKGVSGRYWRSGDSVQTLTINGTPTGGTFIVGSGGNFYTAAYNAASSTLQTNIQNWGGLYAGVTVSGSAGGPYTITFPERDVQRPGARRAVQRQRQGIDRRHQPERDRGRGRCWRTGHPDPCRRWRLVAVRLRRGNGHQHQDQSGGVLLGRIQLALGIPGEPRSPAGGGLLRIRRG